jgi:hypothetical protein
MKPKLLHLNLSLLSAVTVLIGAVGQQSIALGATDSSGIDRTVLPIKEPTYPPITEIDARKAKAPPLFQVRAPSRAPNVLVILLDNLGFGATGPFGGIINMPTLERLAKNGVTYTNFHTAPLC